MSRDEQEMIMWRRAYERWYAREGYEVDTCGNVADAAVEQFRKRYPPQPTAPRAVWYDEPQFAKDGQSHPCWVAGEPFPCAVYWSGLEWRVYVAGDSHVHGLRGRRVSPITKPQEPPQ